MKRDLISMAIAELKRVHEAGLNFNYDRWGEINSCGTVACAGGYLAIFKPFRILGLGAVSKDDLTPKFKGEYSGRALAKFFDLPLDRVLAAFIWLNGPYKDVCEITALDVANKLQEYLDADVTNGGV